MTAKRFISNHLAAYIKLKMYDNKVDEYFLAKNVQVDSNQLINSLNTCYRVNDDVVKVLIFLNTDVNSVFKRNLSFEKLRNDFFYAVFYSLDDRTKIYHQILQQADSLKSSPYSIDILMMKYIFCISVEEDYSNLRYYLDRFSVIMPFLSSYYRKLYYVFLLSYLDNTSQYKDILNIFNYVSNLPCEDINLKGRLYYTGLSIFRSLGNLEKAKNNYFQAKQYLSEANNIAMLENLNLKYSGLLRVSGEIQAALKNDLKLLEDYTVKQYRLRNIEILFNNIGWTYSLLHNYKKAVVYYQKALETLDDNDVYFNMAYCLYKTGEENLSRTYIQQGKEAPESNSFARPFLEWLDLMIDEKYSEKSYKTLVSILKHHDTDLEDVVKDTIQIEIVNYYYYNHMYEEAIHALQPLMGKQLISPSELIFTKKNENRNDLLFSEDELTLRSQMMESEDLFFEDDELGEDEWEELDDSFSRFTHN